MFRAVLVVCALLIGACGSEPDKPAKKPERGGGTTDLRATISEDDREPVETCDGSAVEVVEVTGDAAMRSWRALRQRAGTSGRWPVLIGAPDEVPALTGMVEFNCDDGYTFERTLERADEVDLERALARTARRYLVRPQDLRGSTPLPDEPPSDAILTPLDLTTNKPMPVVRIALLPIDASWKAPAFLPFGHYNDNPPPPVHVALLREWNRRYGAEIVSLTGDVIELTVPRPPTTDEAALALARQQFQYAPDIVQQGTGDVETLAAYLKDGHAWYFWWD